MSNINSNHEKIYLTSSPVTHTLLGLPFVISGSKKDTQAFFFLLWDWILILLHVLETS